MFVLGVVACFVAVVAGASTAWRELRSEVTTGRVVQVHATNSTCGNGRAKSPCTRFDATVAYDDRGSRRSLQVDAGYFPERGQSEDRASYRPGDEIAVRYVPGSEDARVVGGDSPWTVTIVASFLSLAWIGLSIARPVRSP